MSSDHRPPPSRAIAAGNHAVLHLARFLYAEARRESVRTREALAASIGNRVRRLLLQQLAADAGRMSAGTVRAALFVACIDALPAPRAAVPPPDCAVFASCLRIARRAVSGALLDPTGGATGFRNLGRMSSDPAPAANDVGAVTLIGSYLFLADPEPQAAETFTTH